MRAGATRSRKRYVFRWRRQSGAVRRASEDTYAGAGTASKLEFSVSPSSSYAGETFAAQPIVLVQDSGGNTIFNAVNIIDLSISTDPAGGSTLAGTTSLSAANGVADFNSSYLNINKIGAGFVLQAASSGLTPALSDSFNIISPIVVTSPNGGEVWTVNSAKQITWAKYGSLATGADAVLYSLDNGQNWVSITSNGNSPQNWVTPNQTTTQAKIKVCNSANAQFCDESNSAFNLTGGFTLIAPNGGEVWSAQNPHTISWSTLGVVSNVKLQYSTNGGSSWADIATFANATGGQYLWTPPVAAGSTSARIKILDAANPDVYDISNANYILQNIAISAPVENARWKIGTTQRISWLSTGIDNVKIEYSTDNFTTANTIIASTPAAAGFYDWVISPDLNPLKRENACYFNCC